jgi:hypothetical protein
MDGARGLLNMDVNWPGTPFVVRQVDGVAYAKSGDEYLHLNPQNITFSRGIIMNTKNMGIFAFYGLLTQYFILYLFNEPFFITVFDKIMAIPFNGVFT